MNYTKRIKKMNKRHIIASLNNIANKLDNSGLYKEATSLTNVMKRLAGDDPIFDPRQKEFPLDTQRAMGQARVDLSQYQQSEETPNINDSSKNVENKKPFITIEVNEYGDTETYTFDSGFTIGRADQNDIVTKIPYISREHCFIYYTKQYNCWMVKDLDSKAGTFIGNAKLDDKPFALSKNYTIKLDNNFKVKIVDLYPESLKN